MSDPERMMRHLKHMREVRPDGLDREAAAWAIGEIESLRKQWLEGICNILEKVKTNKAILDEANVEVCVAWACDRQEG